MIKPTQISRRFDANLATDCWIWKYLWDRKGRKAERVHPIVLFNGKYQRASRVIYQLFKGPIPEGMLICHHCDNSQCVNPDHLFLGTEADNARDAAIKNRMRQKLSLEDVAEIRRLHIEGFSQYEIGRMFKVGQSYISRVISRQRRPHV